MLRGPVATANEWRAKAEAENLTIRELIIEVTGRQSFVGSPARSPTTINHFVQDDASDGFILVPHITPGGLEPFVDQVVPLLQERGVFRAEYDGTTLRDHLGLAPLRGAAPNGTRRQRSAAWLMTTPLAVLDLVPISSGSTAAEALRNSIDLAQQAERLGYARYWFAEHHLNPGVAGTSPAVVLALTAAATSTIRLGSGAVQMGHRTALSTVEEFGLLDAAAPRPLRPRPRAFRWPATGTEAAGAGRRRRRPRSWTAARRTGCASRSRSRSSTCSVRPASRCRRRCCNCRARSRRTTPSRSTTSWP